MPMKINSPNVQYTDDAIISNYDYLSTDVTKSDDGTLNVTPTTTKYTFKTQRNVPKVGLMLVGWGGNNGSTVSAGILANKKNISWETKEGTRNPDYFGSITQASTARIGSKGKEEFYVPLNDIVPMVHPNDFVIGGWDINSAPLDEAMKRAQVLPITLQQQLAPMMKEMKPLKAIHRPHFIASNQDDRADNYIDPEKYSVKEQVEIIRKDIRDFKQKEKVDKVIVLWTANTERFCNVRKGLNDSADSLMKSIEKGESEISSSTLYCVAAIMEKCSYINGSPQNTFVPGVVELARKHRVFIAGDDFKSGQTKFKSVLVDFLVSAGIKPTSIVSYNHLGNNDGKNLSAPAQFRSKEISKSNVVDDMVHSNKILYPEPETKDKPDHVVVIKYVPYVADSKRALDEYTSEIFMGGKNTIVCHNTCEDSLLAAPLIIDLAILTELMERVQFKTDEMQEFDQFHPVLSILSYLLKAPMVPEDTPLVNSLTRQRNCIENILKALVGLPSDNHMLLENKHYK